VHILDINIKTERGIKVEYLINGTSYGPNDVCFGKCDCKGQYIEPCIKTCTRIEPCACKANFCGAEICSPVKIQPASKK
jgi:hypothetical protein